MAKIYIKEPGSERVAALLNAAEEIVVSLLAVPEVISALNRGLREHRVKPSEYSKLKSRFLHDVRHWTLVTLDEASIEVAVACLEKGTPRTLDAVQIGCAKVSGCEVMVSSDDRQSRAAQIMDLGVEFVG